MGKNKTIGIILVLLIAAGGGVAYWKHQQGKGAVAKIKRPKTHETPTKKAAPAPPKKEPKATVLSPAAKEHLAEREFITALRTVFIWHSHQPNNPETAKTLLAKLTELPSDGLPPSDKAAWQSLLESWQGLSDPGKPADPRLKDQGQKAADTLNAMLKAQGEGDLTF